jgi:hypothetical protein
MIALVLATFAAGFSCAFAILGKVARIVLGAAAAVAVLTALAAGFGCTFAVIGEVAGAVLPADMASARGFLAILGEVARIPRMSLFGHRMYLLMTYARTGVARLYCNGRIRRRLTSRLL